MTTDYSQEQYTFWTECYSVNILRKLENETAFDGIVKIYSLKSNEDELNKIFEDKVFGDFYYPTSFGFFLRMFETKNSWPKTILVFINLKNYRMEQIKKTD